MTGFFVMYRAGLRKDVTHFIKLRYDIERVLITKNTREELFMLKQALIYLALSILVVVFARYFHKLVVYIDVLYTWCNVKLAPVFSRSGLGLTIRQILVLTLLPIALASVPALGYRIIKGGTMPYYYFTTWFFWLVIVLSVLLFR